MLWENIFGGGPGAKYWHDGWMHSQGHRNNILSPEVTAMGAGIACDERGGGHATENFSADAWTGAGTPAQPLEPLAVIDLPDIRCPLPRYRRSPANTVVL